VTRIVALATLLALAACNRGGVADVTLDADAAQRNTTAAKTLSDLAAADEASRGPAPVYATPAPQPAESIPEPVAPVPVIEDDSALAEPPLLNAE
jgi:hypothetical protein